MPYRGVNAFSRFAYIGYDILFAVISEILKSLCNYLIRI